jgi:hypothetical protein
VRASPASDKKNLRRVVALGASNLTRGLQTVVASARAEWGADVEILGALGHGRSYGGDSRFLVRRLPGILQSGLWRQLEALPAVRTRALVTDVGNDIAYGHSAEQTLQWVEEAIDRLQQHTDDIVLTDVPLHSIGSLSNGKFLFFRSLFVPGCRLTLDELVERLRRVNDGLLAIGAARGLHVVRLRPDWYGPDPIHIRPSKWHMAWQEILGSDVNLRRRDMPRLEALRLYRMRPERQWIFEREQVAPQTGSTLELGARLWLY